MADEDSRPKFESFAVHSTYDWCLDKFSTNSAMYGDVASGVIYCAGDEARQQLPRDQIQPADRLTEDVGGMRLEACS